MIHSVVRGCCSKKIYAQGTEEEVHQQLLEQFPLKKRKVTTGNLPRRIIEVYPQPLKKTKVRVQ